jgi:WD40 repeat protein
MVALRFAHGIALSADGSRIAFESQAFVHGASWGDTELASWKGGGPVPDSLGFSADGSACAVGFDQGVVVVLDGVAWKERLRLDVTNLAVVWVAFSPDGKLIHAATNDKQVKTFDASSGSPVAAMKLLGGSIDDLALSHDGRRAVVVTDSEKLWLWNVAEKTFVRLTPTTPGVDFRDERSVAISGDGTLVAIGSTKTSTIDVWEVPALRDGERPAPARTLVSGVPSRLAISASGDRLLVLLQGGALELWNPRTGERVSAVGVHPDANRLALSSDGRRALTQAGPTVKGWDLASEPPTEAWQWQREPEKRVDAAPKKAPSKKRRG